MNFHLSIISDLDHRFAVGLWCCKSLCTCAMPTHVESVSHGAPRIRGAREVIGCCGLAHAQTHLRLQKSGKQPRVNVWLGQLGSECAWWGQNLAKTGAGFCPEHQFDPHQCRPSSLVRSPTTHYKIQMVNKIAQSAAFIHEEQRRARICDHMSQTRPLAAGSLSNCISNLTGETGGKGVEL